MSPSNLLHSLIALALLCLTTSAFAKPSSHISFAGGDGSSMEKAIVIKGGTEETGVAAEYDYLAKHYPGYKMIKQALLSDKGRSYDSLEFTTKDGKKKIIYFDITSFFGKG